MESVESVLEVGSPSPTPANVSIGRNSCKSKYSKQEVRSWVGMGQAVKREGNGLVLVFPGGESGK